MSRQGGDQHSRGLFHDSKISSQTGSRNQQKSAMDRIKSGSVPIIDESDLYSKKALNYQNQLDVFRIEEEMRNMNLDSSQEMS